MKNRLFFLLKYYLFWLFFACVARSLFLLYFHSQTVGFGGYEFGMIFLKGLRMDLSLGGYVMLLSAALFAVLNFLPRRWSSYFFRTLTLVLLIIFITIVLGDFQVFNVWGYHIDSSVIGYIKTPKEAFASGSTSVILLSALCLFVFTALFYFGFNRRVGNSLSKDTRKWWHSFIFLLFGGLMIIPIRGGFNVAPMNSGFVYFSTQHPFANEAAVNSVWNFLYEAAHYNKRKSSFYFMEQSLADTILNNIYHTSGNQKTILNTSTPNIVFLLMESFTANAVGCTGGKKGITPNLDKLAKEGVLFSNIYATGARSDRGLAGVLSAMPAHPVTPILRIRKKSTQFPTFAKDLQKRGYRTHFYYTGDLNFGGFRPFIASNFQHIVTEDDFSGEAIAHRMKWGVHDGYMFDKLFADMHKASSPWLFFAFTLSSHEPFDVPGKKRIEGTSSESIFLNSVAYADAELGKFIAKCKESGIWDNTLFVLVADHGVRYVGDSPPNDLKSFHIPMVFSGGAVSIRDTMVTKIGSQTDLAATLLAQMEIPSSTYRYSRNLLADSVPQVAFFSNPGAVGVYSKKGVSVFDIKGCRFIEGDSSRSNRTALQAYLQTIEHEQLN